MSAPSFLTNLETDIKIIAPEAVKGALLAGQIVSVFNPAAGALITGIAAIVQNSVLNSELASQAKQMSSNEKQSYAVADFSNAFSLAQQVLNHTMPGAVLTYDNGALTDAINANVEALNKLNALVGSVKMTTPPAKG
jgi:hypothetical protein